VADCKGDFSLLTGLFLSSPLVGPLGVHAGAGGLEQLSTPGASGRWKGRQPANLWSSLPSAGGRARKSPDGEWLRKKREGKKKGKIGIRTLAFMNDLA